MKTLCRRSRLKFSWDRLKLLQAGHGAMTCPEWCKLAVVGSTRSGRELVGMLGPSRKGVARYWVGWERMPGPSTWSRRGWASKGSTAWGVREHIEHFIFKVRHKAPSIPTYGTKSPPSKRKKRPSRTKSLLVRPIHPKQPQQGGPLNIPIVLHTAQPHATLEPINQEVLVRSSTA